MNLKITQELFDAYRNGNNEVGDMIFDMAYDRIKSHVFKITKSKEDAEEITQDAFIKFWQQRETIKNPNAFYIYLFAVVKSTTNDYFRNKSKEIVYSFEDVNDVEDMMGDIMPDPERFFISMENELLLEKIVSEMPHQKQKVFTMYRIEGCTVGEISKKLQISERTVEYHIYHAIKQLKEIFLTLFVMLVGRGFM